MGKKESTQQESWSSRMKDFGGGNFTFLSDDGDTLVFIVVGLPELLEGVFKGKKQERIGMPIVSEDGFQLLIAGKRLARKISKKEKLFSTNAFMVTRVGGEGDINTKYPLKVLDEKETYDALCVIRDEDFTPDMIADAVKEAAEVLKG